MQKIRVISDYVLERSLLSASYDHYSSTFHSLVLPDLAGWLYAWTE
jgi:hypothetical protein